MQPDELALQNPRAATEGHGQLRGARYRMIKIIAVLCSLSSGQCHDQTVTTNEWQQSLTMSACMVGMPALAEWMKQHPAERLASWKCQIGVPARGSV